MEKKLICSECGGTITRTTGNYRYPDGDLPNVTLVNVILESCDSCEEGSGVVIPRLAQLHRALARVIAKSTSRLSPGEIRFLRKSLGWSAKDFARHIGADPSTVSRWENGVQSMGNAAERFLRLAAIELEPVDEYPLPDRMDGEPRKWVMEPGSGGEWALLRCED